MFVAIELNGFFGERAMEGVMCERCLYFVWRYSFSLSVVRRWHKSGRRIDGKLNLSFSEGFFQECFIEGRKFAVGLNSGFRFANSS